MASMAASQAGLSTAVARSVPNSVTKPYTAALAPEGLLPAHISSREPSICGRGSSSTGGHESVQ